MKRSKRIRLMRIDHVARKRHKRKATVGARQSCLRNFSSSHDLRQSQALKRKSYNGEINDIPLHHCPYATAPTMAKSEAEAAAKKERKEAKKKRKHDESAAAEDDVEITKEQRKKDKKRKSGAEVAAPVGVDEDGDVKITDAAPDTALALKEEGNGEVAKVKVEVPLAALVPFANPLCDEKSQKKVLKGVKKGEHGLHHLNIKTPSPY